MNFKEFEYVITLAEEMNFTKASRRLFISQPSLSQYINRIENELGVPLFDRSGTPLTLTYEGELYVETAKKIINEHRRMMNTFNDSGIAKKGRLSIGVTPARANHPLPIILSEYANRFPNIELSITEASSGALEEHMEKGLIDISVLNMPILSENITAEPLLTEKIMLVIPEAHRLASSICEARTGGLEYTDIKRFSGSRFILLHPGQRLRHIANDVFVKSGIRPGLLMETRNMETAVRLVSHGIGITFAPESYMSISGPKGAPLFFPIGDPPLSWTLGIAFRKDGNITKAAAAFADVSREVIRKSN